LVTLSPGVPVGVGKEIHGFWLNNNRYHLDALGVFKNINSTRPFS
jgi:hypothetical protein